MNSNSGLGLAAATLLLAGAGGAALAHPHSDGDGGERKVERVVVIGDGDHGDHGKGKEVRHIEIVRHGDHEEGGPRVRRFEMHGDRAMVDCAGEKIVDESGEQGGRKTKVVICAKGGDGAMTEERLGQALARIQSNDELSDEQKARIETALRSAMERARSAR